MFRDQLSGIADCEFIAEPLTDRNAELYKYADAMSVFIHSHITPATLAKLPSLKFVATNSTGHDHIDTAACGKRGIAVSNVPSYGENTVAEHAFALILALTRKIVDSATRIKQGKFSLEGLRGFDLKGRTIGVAGTGRIGKHVIRMAHGFEMKILAYDMFPEPALESHYPLRYVSLPELLAESDIISLHTPYSRQTHHMINQENISLIKRGAILINTARGGLVQTSALTQALQDGILRGAGLDVLEEEGIVEEDSKLITGYLDREQLSVALQDHRLIAMDNVIVTPHNAFNSEEAVLRVASTTIENFMAWHKGKPANNVAAF